MDQFPLLFSPLRIGTSLTLRNRLVVSPHTTVFSAPGGYLTQRDADYWGARAQGGVALAVLGTNVVHASSPIDYGVLANLDDSYIPGYRLVADAVHAHGAALFAQLNHQGLAARGHASAPLRAPSPFPAYIYGEMPDPLDAATIGEIVRAFAAAAGRCQRAGVDGVLVHGAHGYLINEFLSPLTNRRTDEYGGSLDNRMRLLREVLAAIRAAVGRDYPLGVRLSVDELVPGGLTLDESLEIVRWLDRAAAVDYIDVSCGVDYDWMSHGRHYPGMHQPDGTWVALAGAVKAAVGLPVSCAGRIRSPQQAEQLLAAGMLDLAQMARALIADPELPNKARTGRTDEIRPCIYISSGCLGRLYRGLPISCVQNPAVGREAEYGEVRPAAVARRVVVVGGGPAGMQAAITARQRGHAVTLFERAGRLGGQMRTAALGAAREELLGGVEYLEREVRRLGVDVRLGAAADAAAIRAERPDAVIVAAGSDPVPFAAADGAAMSIRAALEQPERVGQRVLVLDGLGRLAASSVAETLALAGREVAIISRDYTVGAHIDHTTRPEIERRLRASGVRQISGTEILDFAGGGASLRDCFTLREWRLDGLDTLVYDLGGLARDALYHALAAEGIEAYRVGDALTARGLEEAYHEGFEVAFRL